MTRPKISAINPISVPSMMNWPTVPSLSHDRQTSNSGHYYLRWVKDRYRGTSVSR
jgi:hypothetical protein